MKVRFAPSPTGFIHIGNVRTAVINFIIAQKEGAKMVLRIEDTDRERSTLESEKSIIEDLKWLGISWNEGPDVGGTCGPYRQSERFDIYNEYTEKLLASGAAYHCYCTQEELDAQRKQAEAEKTAFVYPGTCRNLTLDQKKERESRGIKPTVRFRVPDGETVVVKDLIKGDVTFSSENIGGDFILVRSDGTPVYNYIVSIDDALMGVTHVIRGEDHLSNTPKQILVARAMGLKEPAYAHLALVLGPDRSKLSKRHGMTSLNMYREEGYLPEALMNYLSMLGWAAKDDEEILSIEKIIEQIDLNNLSKSAAVFDFQKLKWVNGKYLRDLSLPQATNMFIPFIEKAGYDTSKFDPAYLEQLVSVLQIKCDILKDIQNLAPIFLDEVTVPDESAIEMLSSEEGKAVIKAAHELFSSTLTADNFTELLVERVKEATGQKGKKLFMPIRAMLTGRTAGPEMDQAKPLIGYERCKKRVQYCYDRFC